MGEILVSKREIEGREGDREGEVGEDRRERGMEELGREEEREVK